MTTISTPLELSEAAGTTDRLDVARANIQDLRARLFMRQVGSAPELSDARTRIENVFRPSARRLSQAAQVGTTEAGAGAGRFLADGYAFLVEQLPVAAGLAGGAVGTGIAEIESAVFGDDNARRDARVTARMLQGIAAGASRGGEASRAASPSVQAAQAINQSIQAAARSAVQDIGYVRSTLPGEGIGGALTGSLAQDVAASAPSTAVGIGLSLAGGVAGAAATGGNPLGAAAGAAAVSGPFWFALEGGSAYTNTLDELGRKGVTGTEARDRALGAGALYGSASVALELLGAGAVTSGGRIAARAIPATLKNALSSAAQRTAISADRTLARRMLARGAAGAGSIAVASGGEGVTEYVQSVMEQGIVDAFAENPVEVGRYLGSSAAGRSFLVGAITGGGLRGIGSGIRGVGDTITDLRDLRARAILDSEREIEEIRQRMTGTTVGSPEAEEGTPEANADTGVPRGTSPEEVEIVPILERYARQNATTDLDADGVSQTGIPQITVVEPSSPVERDVVTFARERGVLALLVESDGELAYSGMYSDPGVVILDRNRGSDELLTGLAYHEMVHALRSANPTAFNELYRAVRELDPEGLSDAGALQESRREDLGAPVPESQSEEEALATFVERLGRWVSFARTDGGVARLARIAENNPTLLERVADLFQRALRVIGLYRGPTYLERGRIAAPAGVRPGGEAAAIAASRATTNERVRRAARAAIAVKAAFDTIRDRTAPISAEVAQARRDAEAGEQGDDFREVIDAAGDQDQAARRGPVVDGAREDAGAATPEGGGAVGGRQGGPDSADGVRGEGVQAGAGGTGSRGPDDGPGEAVDARAGNEAGAGSERGGVAVAGGAVGDTDGGRGDGVGAGVGAAGEVADSGESVPEGDRVRRDAGVEAGDREDASGDPGARGLDDGPVEDRAPGESEATTDALRRSSEADGAATRRVAAPSEVLTQAWWADWLRSLVGSQLDEVRGSYDLAHGEPSTTFRSPESIPTELREAMSESDDPDVRRAWREIVAQARENRRRLDDGEPVLAEGNDFLAEVGTEEFVRMVVEDAQNASDRIRFARDAAMAEDGVMGMPGQWWWSWRSGFPIRMRDESGPTIRQGDIEVIDASSVPLGATFEWAGVVYGAGESDFGDVYFVPIGVNPSWTTQRAGSDSHRAPFERDLIAVPAEAFELGLPIERGSLDQGAGFAITYNPLSGLTRSFGGRLAEGVEALNDSARPDLPPFATRGEDGEGSYEAQLDLHGDLLLSRVEEVLFNRGRAQASELVAEADSRAIAAMVRVRTAMPATPIVERELAIRIGGTYRGARAVSDVLARLDVDPLRFATRDPDDVDFEVSFAIGQLGRKRGVSDLDRVGFIDRVRTVLESLMEFDQLDASSESVIDEIVERVRDGEDWEDVSNAPRPSDEELAAFDRAAGEDLDGTGVLAEAIGNIAELQELQEDLDTLAEGDPGQGMLRLAFDRFGETDDMRVAAYVAPDGRMIDGSGVTEGAWLDPRNPQRQMDHRQIATPAVSPFMGDRSLTGGEAMVEFIKTSGAIRVDGPSGLVDMNQRPTPEQIEVISESMEGNEFVTIERFNDRGESIDTRELDSPSAAQIAGAMRSLFREDDRFATRDIARVLRSPRAHQVLDADVEAVAPQERAQFFNAILGAQAGRADLGTFAVGPYYVGDEDMLPVIAATDPRSFERRGLEDQGLRFEGVGDRSLVTMPVTLGTEEVTLVGPTNVRTERTGFHPERRPAVRRVVRQNMAVALMATLDTLGMPEEYSLASETPPTRDGLQRALRDTTLHHAAGVLARERWARAWFIAAHGGDVPTLGITAEGDQALDRGVVEFGGESALRASLRRFLVRATAPLAEEGGELTAGEDPAPTLDDLGRAAANEFGFRAALAPETIGARGVRELERAGISRVVLYQSDMIAPTSQDATSRDVTGEVFEFREDAVRALESLSVGGNAAPEAFERFATSEPEYVRTPIGFEVNSPVAWRHSQSNLPGFEVTAESRRGVFLRLFHDHMRPVSSLLSDLRRQGGYITDQNDVYLLNDLRTGRTMTRIDAFWRGRVEPLMNSMKRQGVTLDELGTYLYARHAPERNARVREINPHMRDEGIAGSGMTDQEAADNVARLVEKHGEEKLEDLAERVYSITRATNEIRVEAGVHTQEDMDRITGNFNRYVPLIGDMNQDWVREGINPARNSNSDSVGRVVHRMAGRSTIADNPILHVVTQHEAAIAGAEKNNVYLGLVRLAEENPDTNLWEVNRTRRKAVFDSDTGLVRYITLDEDLQDPRVVRAYRDGRQVTVTVKVKGVARAVRGDGVERAGAIVRYLGGLTRFLAMVNTQLNPEFVLVNLVRDVQTAIANQATMLTAEQRQGLARRIASGIPEGVAAYWSLERGAGDSANAQAYTEFREDGGTIGFFGLKDIESQLAEVDSRLRKAAGWRGSASVRTAGGVAGAGLGFIAGSAVAGPVGAAVGVAGGAALASNTKGALDAISDLVSDANSAVENAVRFSVYKVARESGVSRPRAAEMAKNVTVNFNRRGEWGNAINALYMFWNAAVQGSATMIKAINTPVGRRIAAGLVAFGALSEVWNQLVSPDDDDGEKVYAKIPEFIKATNLIIMLPGTKTYIKIPLPYGYNALFGVGRNGTALGFGSVDMRTALEGTLDTAIQAFNPMGGGGEVLTSWPAMADFLSPTFADPVVQIAANRGFAGFPIYPERYPYEEGLPEFRRFFNSSSPVSRDIAEFLNTISGGDDVTPGLIDVSPEVLDHLTEFVTGQAGRTVIRTASAPGRAVEGDLPLGEVPILRRFADRPRPERFRQRYYKVNSELMTWQTQRRAYERVLLDPNTELSDRVRLESKYVELLERRDRELTFIEDVWLTYDAVIDRRLGDLRNAPGDTELEGLIEALRVESLSVYEAWKRGSDVMTTPVLDSVGDVGEIRRNRRRSSQRRDRDLDRARQDADQ